MTVSRSSPEEKVVVDSETGEIQTPVLSVESEQPDWADNETGEPTQKRLVYQRSKFRVPRSALKVQVFDTAILDTNKKDSEKFFDVTLLVFPLLVLLPAWAIIVYVLAEMIYHNWAHDHEDTHAMCKTPMRLLFDASCPECVSRKQMQKVGKLQDELTLKVHSRRILNYNNYATFGIGS